MKGTRKYQNEYSTIMMYFCSSSSAYVQNFGDTLQAISKNGHR